jgi:four helix bundle protein
MGNFKQLLVWQRAMDLIELVYAASRRFPPDERFGLTSQLRRAVISVASNIAESEGRNGDRESSHFLGIARGSLREVDCQLQVAQRLRYLTPVVAAELLVLIDELSRMLSSLIRHRRR